MRIACEKCSAVYSIAEKIIGHSGRLVKCAKCSHTWKVEKGTPNDIPYIPKQYNTANKTSSKTYLKVFTILLFSLTLAITVLIFFSKDLMQYKTLRSIYEKFSVYDSREIKLSNCTFRVENDDIIIDGEITNHSNEDKKMPSIKYTLLDKNKKIVFSYVLTPKQPIIRAKETLPIDGKIENIKQPVKYLQIDIGNKLDLLVGS